MSEVPHSQGTAGTQGDLMRQQLADLRGQVAELRAFVASLLQERVDKQELAAASHNRDLLQEQLEDSKAQILQLRADKDAEIARLCTEKDNVTRQMARIRSDADAELARLESQHANVVAAKDAEIQRFNAQFQAETAYFRSEIFQLRADKDAETARLVAQNEQHGRAAVNPQDHAAAVAQNDCLRQQLDFTMNENAQFRRDRVLEVEQLRTDKDAEIARLVDQNEQLRADHEAEVARLQAVFQSQLARVEAAVQQVALFTCMPSAVAAREIEARTELMAEEAVATQALPPQPWPFPFDRTVPRSTASESLDATRPRRRRVNRGQRSHQK